MIYIDNLNLNPYFNIALEEYVLKNIDEECFMLYQNEPSLIVGKHQNALGELNYDFVQKRNIQVVRRLSGGGTVYHDLGNLNFTFIRRAEKGNMIDFVRFVEPIVEVLQSLGVNAQIGKRNDLLIEGKKFSGNAEHIHKDKVLHHGTLLFDSDLDVLIESIKINPTKYSDKSIKSVRSTVTNISEYLKVPLTILELKVLVFKHIASTFNAKRYTLTTTDIEQVNQLVETKYSTWEWNFGFSPTYVFQKTIQNIAIRFEVRKGYITNVEIEENELLKEVLENTLHNELIIRQKLDFLKDTINVDSFVKELF